MSVTSKDIIYIDNKIIVVNKPAGVTTVQNKSGKPDLTMLVSSYLKEKTGYPPKFIAACNRLDRDTSGIVVIALKKSAASHVNEQFEKRKAVKHYVALCSRTPLAGHKPIDPEKAKGKIDGYLKEVSKLRFVLTDKKEGSLKHSLTYYETCSFNKNSDVLKFILSPKTGRTHQLRVHLKSIGYPILGDPFYGETVVNGYNGRMYLHAFRLEIAHPESGEKMVFTAPSEEFEVFDT